MWPLPSKAPGRPPSRVRAGQSPACFSAVTNTDRVCTCQEVVGRVLEAQLPAWHGQLPVNGGTDSARAETSTYLPRAWPGAPASSSGPRPRGRSSAAGVPCAAETSRDGVSGGQSGSPRTRAGQTDEATAVTSPFLSERPGRREAGDRSAVGPPSAPQPRIPLSSWLAALPRPCPPCRLPWELGLGGPSSFHQCLPGLSSSDSYGS